MTDLMDPCPHHTPNAGGSVASELHGICIFCWRDRAAALRQDRDRLQIERDVAAARLSVEEGTSFREALLAMQDQRDALSRERDGLQARIAKLDAVADAARHVIRWREYEADPAAYKQEHEGWAPLLPWRHLHATVASLDQDAGQ